MGAADVVERHGHFVWYELMTTDVEAARAFYVEVMGWDARDASAPGAAYTLFTVGETSVGGLMTLTEDARKLGAQPRWLGYIGVDDVDAAVDRIKHLGGAVHVPPTDIPDVSRFSVVADPQMAMLVLIAWTDPGDGPLGDMDRPGHVGWHELVAAEWKSAFAFYAELFGWQRAHAAIDPMGTYQLFSVAGRTI